ncbi:deoxynucleoside kinase [Mycoplasma bradburyae]|uniref:deoxynucleoside kinase n=1 Tax=Mycoplasma bradburyae TaxID=2963128 RepID=UPI00233F7D9D|nr:deoxynucleoside kinase [Mycoplasma bradburyae]MDC4184240.1 deoxynucleoside kinase [Mycoplasma bradburyae]
MLIAISGMVASGKSSLSKRLSSYFSNSKILLEYEENDKVFSQFLEWLYNKNGSIDFAFQSYIVQNYSRNLKQALNEKHDYIFADRFNQEHFIFAKNKLTLKPKKYLRAYEALFDVLISEDKLPDLVIYLDFNFEEFKKRIFKRNRLVETTTFENNLDYWKHLHQIYKQEFINQQKKFNFNVVYLDTNDKNEEEVFNEAINIIKRYKQNKNEN